MGNLCYRFKYHLIVGGSLIITLILRYAYQRLNDLIPEQVANLQMVQWLYDNHFVVLLLFRMLLVGLSGIMALLVINVLIKYLRKIVKKQKSELEQAVKELLKEQQDIIKSQR